MTPIRYEPFQKFLPKRSASDTLLLRQKMLAEGCVDPLRVWTETGQLLDGYNRLDICEADNIPYTVVGVSLPDEPAAFAWIIENQLSRRNLTDAERTYFIGHQYLQRKQSHGGDRKATEDQDARRASCSGDTAEIIGKEHDVAPRTVQNAAEFAAAVDAHEAAEPGAKEKILKGEAGPKRKVIESAPILCQRCRENGAARDCRWCAEEADKAAAKKRSKSAVPPSPATNDPRKAEPVIVPLNESAEGVTSCEAGGGHPFLMLLKDIRLLSASITKAIKQDGEDAYRLQEYLAYCGLLEFDKESVPHFMPLRGVSKVVDMAGAGGKMLAKAKVEREYLLACGGIRPWIPPATARRRAEKAKKK